METDSLLVLLDELSALFETANDLVVIGQIAYGISTRWVRLDRENLAVHPKAANAVVGAELKRGMKGVGIFPAETA